VRSVLLLSVLAVMVVGIKINTVPGDTMVWEGSRLELGVRTDSAWFLCVWTSPSGDKQCAIQESGVSSVCAGDPRIVIRGNSQTCGITVYNVTTEDWGRWMCLVQDGEDFNTHRKYINVEVATGAAVTLSWNDNNNNNNNNDNNQEALSGRILEVMEDTETNIYCAARKAYPRPTFLWSPPESLTLGSEKTVESYNNQTHEYSSYSSVIYNAKLNETNSTIICRVLQDETYVETISVIIKVNPKPLPLILDSRADTAGIIAGVILSVIFLLLILVILLVFIVQRSRRKVSRQQTPDTTSEDERDFRQVIRPVWRTGASGGRYDGQWSKYIHDTRPSLPDHNNLSLDTEGSLHSDSGHTFNGTRSTKTMSIISGSSQSYQTERELEQMSVSLCPATSLQETHFSEGRDVTTVQHRPSVSYLEQFRPEVYYRKPSSTRSEFIGAGHSNDFGAGYFSSRPASALDLYLHPSNLPQRVTTPTCAGSKTSVFHCQHDCFAEELSGTTIEEMSEEEDIDSIQRLVSLGLDVGTDGFTDSSEGDKERKPTATAVTTL